jgi:hypothetical protein
MVVMGAAAVALLIIAMLPRVGPKREEVVVDDDATRNGRFERTERVDEPATTTTDRRV